MRWIIWILTVLFYFYEYFLRISPSVMVNELMESFHITATGVGALSAFYLYIYAPMQIPVGLLMDRFGARRLLTAATVACGLGAFLFCLAFDFPLAAIGRLLMGFGSAFAFVGMVYVSARLFPKKYLALLVALGNSVAMLGAVFGDGPLAYGVTQWGWRPTIVTFGWAGLGLSVLMFIFFRQDPKRQPTTVRAESKWGELLINLRIVWTNPQTWINGAIAFFVYATTTGFAGLWGPSFLRAAHGISSTNAGFAVSMIFVGWLVGGPVIGHLSDRFARRKPFLKWSILGAFVTMLPVIYIPGLPVVAVYLLLFCVGFFSSAQLLNFCVAIELNEPQASATAVAFTNFMIAIVGAIVQPLVGYLLDLNWSGAFDGAIRIYSVSDYIKALTLFPLAMFAGFVLCFFLKEPEHVHPEIEVMD